MTRRRPLVFSFAAVALTAVAQPAAAQTIGTRSAVPWVSFANRPGGEPLGDALKATVR